MSWQTALLVMGMGAMVWSFLQCAIPNFDKLTTGGRNKTPEGQLLRQLIYIGALAILGGLAFASESTLGMWAGIVSGFEWYGQAFKWAWAYWAAADRAPASAGWQPRAIGVGAYFVALIPALIVLGFISWLWSAVTATFYDDEEEDGDAPAATPAAGAPAGDAHGAPAKGGH